MSFTSIALRNIPKRKLRNALTVLAVVLGVTLIVGVNIAFDSVYTQFSTTVNKAIGNVDVSVRSALNLPFNQTTMATVNETVGISDYYGRLVWTANVSIPEDYIVTTLIGVNTTSDFDYLDPDTTNITGQLQLPVNSSSAVVDARLNFTISEFFYVNVTTGDYPDYETTGYILKVVGIYHASEIEQQYGSIFGEGYSGNRIYVDLVKAQTMLNASAKINNINIKLTNPELTSTVCGNLSSQLGSDYVINPVKESLLTTVGTATSGLQSGLQIMSIEALCVAVVIVLNTMYMNIGERTHEIGILRSQGASTRQVFWIFFSESLILGVIGVVIGLALGLFVTDVFRYFTSRIFEPFSPGIEFHLSFPSTTIQHLIVGTAAGLITVMIGGLFPALSACRTSIINALRPSMRKTGKQRTALKLVLVGLPMTIFGAFMYLWYDMLSAYNIGLYVAAALVPIGMIGVTLLASGLLRSGGPLIERSLFGFGKTRKIISRNVERNLLRSTICFGLIGISLSLVVEMGGAQMGTVAGIESVIHSFSSSDLTVMSDGTVPKDFVENLTRFEGVNIATPVLVAGDQTILQNNETLTTFNSSSTVLAIDTVSYPKVMSMTFSDDTPSNVFEQLNNSNTIILTYPLAQSLNVSVGNKVGIRYINHENRTYEQEVEVKTPMGPQKATVKINYTVPVLAWKNYTVVGVAQGAWMDIMSFGNFQLSEASYISYNNLNATFPNSDVHNDTANLFFIKADSNMNVTQTKANLLAAYGHDYKLTVSSYDDAVQRVRSSIDEIFYILYSVVLFAVMNACIGVAAIMIMNVAERRREIGIFRSQGMSKGQVMSSIIGEALFLGVVGFIMGVVVGLMLHRATISYMQVAGFPMGFAIPPESIAIAFTLAIFASVISALYPANKASRQNIVESIRQ